MDKGELLAGVRILAIIPARGGSKGVPGKNIRILGTKPLVYYALRSAQQSRKIDATIVSTDSEEIAKVCRELGADVPFLRPKEFATDTSPDIDFLKHALEFVEKERGWKPEIILFLPPTTPTRTGADIDSALEFMEKTKADSVRTVVDPSPFNPFKMWMQTGEDPSVLEQIYPENGPGKARQLHPKYFSPFSLVYATRAKFVREGKTWGPEVRFIECDRNKFIDIDEPKDLVDAERVMKESGLLE